MADEVIVPVAAPEPIISPAVAPAGEPAGDTAAAAPAVVSPVAPAEIQPEPAQAAEPAKPSPPAASLLGAAVAAEEAKPETATEAATEAPAEGPSFTFNLPEGFRAEPERMAALNSFLGEAGLGQEQGQRLVDMHVAEVQRVQEEMRASLAQQQIDAFKEMRAGWVDEFENDPQLGGNRRQTTINTVVGFLRHFASDGDHLNRLMQIADFTGWGDNPDMIRLFANAAKGLQQQYREPGPVRAERPAPMTAPRYRQRYAASANGSSR